MRLSALSLLLTRAAAWTADGYPDCSATQGPACFPNRRAPNHHSLLNSLFNKWCSDKGRVLALKAQLALRHDTVLRPIRRRARHLLELGVGDETAGSLNAWREYFPRAQFWIADIDVAGSTTRSSGRGHRGRSAGTAATTTRTCGPRRASTRSLASTRPIGRCCARCRLSRPTR